MTIRPIRFLLISFSIVLLITSCKKINEATDLGDEIIPGVDGVTTFDTTLTVQAYNSIFESEKDSVRVNRLEDHILGNIALDPLFGKTNSKIFVELKPDFYKYGFAGIYNKDSLFLDSVVMVLGWTASYGDTMMPQRVRVWEMDQTNTFKRDSFYLLRQQYFTYSNQLGSKEFFPASLKDSVRSFADTATGQLRIRLNNSFGERLLDYDTTTAYASDSAFKTYFKGFAIDADPSMGNALMAFSLAKSKLAIYYRFQKGGQIDTAVSYFKFTDLSAQHNYIERNGFAGTPLLAASNTPTEDPLVYLINAPGSFATVKVPALQDWGNRIINRAELIVEQVFDGPFDNTFGPPVGLMLDVYDSILKDYKLMPYDYVPDQTGSGNVPFGVFGKQTADGAGNPIKVWKFQMTRYVQNLLTKKEPLHDLRLRADKTIIERVKESPTTNGGNYVYFSTDINPHYAFGRVKVGGGNHATQRMRLHIIWTKI